MNSQTGHKVPAPVSNYLKIVEELMGDLLQNPWGADWRAEFSTLRQETLEMRKDLTQVKIAAERQIQAQSQSQSRHAGPSTFASVVRGAPAPAHYQSSHGSSSAAVTASEIAQDREVTVRLNDAAAVNQYRRETPASLTKKAEGLRARAAQAVGSVPLASVRITASRQLRSGDLRFTVQSAKHAELMRTHQEWARLLHKKAEVLLPTWGVVIHDVNVRSLGVNSNRADELKGVQEAVIAKMVAGNSADWGKDAVITRLCWLRSPVGKSGSLVAEFLSPVVANKAIDKGVLWDGGNLTAVLYDRATRVRQCHNCQQWGHIGTSCPTNKPKCVYCAGEHLSRDCSRKADSTLNELKCANCGGAHAAWAVDCPERVKEVEKMKEMGRYRLRYHPVPAYFSINAPSVDLHPPSPSSWGTPVGSNSGTSSNGGSDSSAVEDTQTAPSGGLSATKSVSGLQSSQWNVVEKKKKGKQGKKARKTQSTATAPASLPSDGPNDPSSGPNGPQTATPQSEVAEQQSQMAEQQSQTATSQSQPVATEPEESEPVPMDLSPDAPSSQETPSSTEEQQSESSIQEQQAASNNEQQRQQSATPFEFHAGDKGVAFRPQVAVDPLSQSMHAPPRTTKGAQKTKSSTMGSLYESIHTPKPPTGPLSQSIHAPKRPKEAPMKRKETPQMRAKTVRSRTSNTSTGSRKSPRIAEQTDRIISVLEQEILSSPLPPDADSDYRPSSPVLADITTQTNPHNTRKRGTTSLMRELTIFQYNVNRSKDIVMAQFLRDPTVIAADIIAIQEPWINPFNKDTHHPAKLTHDLVWPSDLEERSRVCMFVSKKLAGWTHFAHSADVQELRLKTICGGDVISEQRSTYLLMGDFNLHHPVWGGDDAEEDAEAEELLTLMDSAELDCWLEPGTVTRMDARSQTTIDLVLASRRLKERMVSCEVSADTHADSDHLPICTVVDLGTEEVEEPVRRRSWKSMDEKKFTEFVSANLLGKSWMHLPGEGDVLTQQIDNIVEHLVEVVQQGVQCSTPWARPSSWAKQGWTTECTTIIKATRQSFRRWKKAKKKLQTTDFDFDMDFDDMINAHSPLYEECADLHEEYRHNRNKKGKIIKKALQQGYRSWIQDTIKEGPGGLWKVSKWARNRGQAGGSSVIPALQRPDGTLAETNEQKAALLHRTHNQIEFPPFTEQEVRDAINRTPPDKAPGPDGLPNRVWRILLGVSNFVTILTSVFNTCTRSGYNPRYFQRSITVTLRKGGPRNFRMPKSYRPIALMNTLGKVLEACIALRISWAVEEYGILPKTHLGGRKGISVDHAIQLILDRVHRAWGAGKKVSMLLLDVSGAYDNVSHERLLYNIKKLRLGFFEPWIRSFLGGRSTRIKLPGFLSDSFATETGIPQGSPISPILFLLFNALLIRGCSLCTGDGAFAQGYGWVDDAAVIVESESYAKNVEALETVLQKADLWARRSAAKFAPDKFELIHFDNPRAPPCAPPTQQQTQQQPTNIYDIIIEDPGTDQMPVRDIKPTQHAKYLGIWLDKQLTFDTHRQRLIGKANASLEALQSLTGSTWGATLSAMRTAYQAVIIPQMLYGVTAWFPNTTTKRNQIINSFTKLQRRAAIMIAGAFKSMSAAALNVELFLLPIQLQIEQITQETAIRIQTGPKWAQPYCLQPRLGKRTPKEIKLGGFSPMEKMKWKKGEVLFGEHCWESKSAFVLPPWGKRIHCVIESSAEAAIKSHDVITEGPVPLSPSVHTQPTEQLLLYSDGSGHEVKYGASAVAPDHGIQARRSLGEQATVYTAELTGIELALDKFKSQEQCQELVIFTDSRAAIQAVQNPKRPSGQFVLRTIYAHVQALRTGTPTTFNPPDDHQVTIRWIPAHAGVLGNELADTAAKEAALGGKGEAGPEEPFPRLASVAKQQVRRKIKERWALLWEKDKTGKPNRKLVPIPHKKTLGLFTGIPKHYAAILVQMRSMRVALKHFLYKINEVESDMCGCLEGSQTPKHILLRYPRFVDKHKEMMDKIYTKTDLNKHRELTSYKAIVSHLRATRYIAKFILQTGLLGQFQHYNIEPEPDSGDDETTDQE
ncbi:hypothetical protein N7454_000598 [Penicillium verhagenii]|nr:hypothetical protein N7454_000598 [Penicillium verhagenii]